MPRWREVATLYVWEIRSALRERSIVVNSIAIPLVLYPFMLWAMFTGVTFVQGQAEGLVSRVALLETGAGGSVPAELLASLRDDPRVRLITPSGGDRAAAERRIREGEIDALVEVEPLPGALAGNLRVRVSFDTARERSALAKDRVAELVDRYREQTLRRAADALHVSPAEWEVFVLESRNVASGRQMGAFVLGLMLPLFFVIMVAVGCFYPAIDATAGERERGTWETLMSTAAARPSIVAAKYLSVATFGGLAGTLNLAAMVLTMKPVMAPLLARTGEAIEFHVPAAAAPILLVAAVLLAGFVAAGMMIFAAFAHTFREGQSMITPFYLLILLPVVALQSPDARFTLPLAAVPVVNVALMVREAIGGAFQWPQIALTVGTSVGAIAAALAAAGYVLRFEDVVTGAFGGGPWRFLRTRVLGRRRAAGAVGAGA
jgi:sodium transport system permease protein